jgi:hypothetical protein
MELGYFLIDLGSWLIAIGLMIGFIVAGAWAVSVLIDVFLGERK